MLSLVVNGVFCEPNCNVVINEINTMGYSEKKSIWKGRHKHGSQYLEKNEYIELKSLCGDLPLRGYKIIGISAEKTPKIELVIDLWNENTAIDGFYLIGGSEINNAQLQVPNDLIMYKNSFKKQPSQLLMSNFLLNGDNAPKGIVLLYKEGERFWDIRLTHDRTFIPITDEILNVIRENLHDMVVYAERAAAEKCSIFEEIQPQFIDRDYMLREFDISFDERDNSLNRCTVETICCVPEKFKVGKRTPGAENDCTGAFFTLTSDISEVREIFNDARHEETESEDVVMIDANSTQCSSSLDAEFYNNLKDRTVCEAVNSAIEVSRADECTESLSSPLGGNIRHEIDRANKRKRYMDEDKDFSEELEWETTKYFK